MVTLHLVDVVCMAPGKRKVNMGSHFATLSGRGTYLSVRIGFTVFNWNTCITLSPPQVTNLESSIHATSKQLATMEVSAPLSVAEEGVALPLSAGYCFSSVLVAIFHS